MKGNLENKQVAIIGGGPGGLTLARLLQLKGVDVKVYERDINRDVRVQGATLDLHFESGLKVMEAADLMDAFKANYRPGADKGRVLDEHAKILYDEHDKESTEDFDDERFRPEIDRGPLRDMLLNSLQPDTVVWDSQFKSMVQIGNIWKLEFKNGNTATADIVIGADGANSKIRPFITSTKPFYSGVTIVQGNVPDSETAAPGIHKLLKGGKLYAYDGEKFLHVSSKGDGSLDFYVSCKKEENWIQNSGINFSDKTQVLAWFKEEFSKWDSVWLELAENVNLPLLLRPQYCMPLDQTWSTLPNLTILGDAAHPMPPSGEGVNLAMLDSLELSECLTNENFKDIQTAIASYEKQMQIRSAKEAQESLEMTEWMHSERATERLLQMLA
ncbi:FAD-dependent oxidoreductase [Leptospira haakeii]|uniref:Flavin-dependent monooxygenase n=1 Tax=Leptospira haakeii TaxID=2023198 RepID=A0ABX4PPH6_9LEPT|nr:NAD(P)/FAD-dependent oxidoreductase [Leptospira haakeii]PKA17705.1 2-polyprenyl-6-methoxyphenol hydroxylase [Leptospira haakeii]PKA21430.1 2-polyprenyl-6-methoxyphenol hydroxylase [Leptospira haakeii]